MKVKNIITGLLLFSAYARNAICVLAEPGLSLYRLNPDTNELDNVSIKALTIKQYVEKHFSGNEKCLVVSKDGHKFYDYKEYFDNNPDPLTLMYSYDGLWEGSSIPYASKEELEKKLTIKCGR